MHLLIRGKVIGLVVRVCVCACACVPNDFVIW